MDTIGIDLSQEECKICLVSDGPENDVLFSNDPLLVYTFSDSNDTILQSNNNIVGQGHHFIVEEEAEEDDRKEEPKSLVTCGNRKVLSFISGARKRKMQLTAIKEIFQKTKLVFISELKSNKKKSRKSLNSSNKNYGKEHKEREYAIIKPYTCEICSKLLRSKTSLIVHQSRHFSYHSIEKTNDVSKVIRCKICERVFISQYMLQFHMESIDCRNISSTDNHRFPCHMCSQSFKFLYLLEAHLSSFHSEIKCPVCGLEFISFSTYRKHVSFHPSTEPCNYWTSSVTKQKAKQNGGTINDNGIYKCSDCNKSYARKTDLNRHEYVHTGIAPWKCSECEASFLTSTKYREHFINSHGTQRKPFICSYCSKDFVNAECWRIHEKSHVNTKAYECTICKKTFSQKGNLRDHMIIHSKDRPWKCSQCDKTFKVKGDLTKHVTIHSGLRPHICTYCLMSFTRHSYLTRHVRTHTGEKPFMCEFCQKTFSRSENCQEHRRIHTGERPYVCHCGASFKDSGNFCNHKKIHDPKRIKRNTSKTIANPQMTVENVDNLINSQVMDSVLQIIPTVGEPFIQNISVNDGSMVNSINTELANAINGEGISLLQECNVIDASDTAQITESDQGQMLTLTTQDDNIINMIQAAAMNNQSEIQLSFGENSLGYICIKNQ